MKSCTEEKQTKESPQNVIKNPESKLITKACLHFNVDKFLEMFNCLMSCRYSVRGAAIKNSKQFTIPEAIIGSEWCLRQCALIAGST